MKLLLIIEHNNTYCDTFFYAFEADNIDKAKLELIESAQNQYAKKQESYNRNNLLNDKLAALRGLKNSENQQESDRIKAEIMDLLYKPKYTSDDIEFYGHHISCMDLISNKNIVEPTILTLEAFWEEKLP